MRLMLSGDIGEPALGVAMMSVSKRSINFSSRWMVLNRMTGSS